MSAAGFRPARSVHQSPLESNVGVRLRTNKPTPSIAVLSQNKRAETIYFSEFVADEMDLPMHALEGVMSQSGYEEGETHAKDKRLTPFVGKEVHTLCHLCYLLLSFAAWQDAVQSRRQTFGC